MSLAKFSERNFNLMCEIMRYAETHGLYTFFFVSKSILWEIWTLVFVSFVAAAHQQEPRPVTMKKRKGTKPAKVVFSASIFL
jgi:hypothetical protein